MKYLLQLSIIFYYLCVWCEARPCFFGGLGGFGGFGGFLGVQVITVPIAANTTSASVVTTTRPGAVTTARPGPGPAPGPVTTARPGPIPITTRRQINPNQYIDIRDRIGPGYDDGDYYSNGDTLQGVFNPENPLRSGADEYDPLNDGLGPVMSDDPFVLKSLSDQAYGNDYNEGDASFLNQPNEFGMETQINKDDSLSSFGTDVLNDQPQYSMLNENFNNGQPPPSYINNEPGNDIAPFLMNNDYGPPQTNV